VPEVLLSGNHEAIRIWRRKEALRSTYLKRPDLLKDQLLNEEDKRLLDDIVREGATAYLSSGGGGGLGT
jgi:tRNA (guanine37-N1)-methyltransferase